MRMTPFRHFEFYDVPRAIVLRHRNLLLFLQSAFDEALDDYPDEYSIYLVPESAEHYVAEGDWESLINSTAGLIGKIPIRNVKFDRTKRKKLDATVLDQALETRS